MRTLTLSEINKVSGGIDSANGQIVSDIAIDAGIGAALTPGAPILGAGLGAAGSVIHSAINNGPVSVPVPVNVGPGWNGSGYPPELEAFLKHSRENNGGGGPL